MKSEKVLVTGGAGSIGTYLVQERMDRGLGVFASDLSNTEHDSHIKS
jgi:nucleoside-diphosphate-sugar epimerase